MPAPTALLARPDDLAQAQATPLPQDGKFYTVTRPSYLDY